jgi:hypothetical protein
MEWEHPESRIVTSSPVRKKPSLFLVPKFRNLGTMGMTEILTALHLLGGIVGGRGDSPTTIALAETFEQAFGFNYNDIYDCQIELFKRMPCNLTKEHRRQRQGRCVVRGGDGLAHAGANGNAV